MINTIFTQLQKYLEIRFAQCGHPADWKVVCDALPKDDSLNSKGLVLTLLRVEQETSHKQQVSYRKEASKTYKVNPDICLNLYVLASAHASTYNTSLHMISETMRILNSDLDPDTDPAPDSKSRSYDTEEFKSVCKFMETLSIEIQNQTVEQCNSMWQTLGHTVVPSVLYKVRMVTLVAPKPAQPTRIVGINKHGEEVMEPIDVRYGKVGKTLDENRADFQADINARQLAEEQEKNKNK